ncbi:hypothetical protein OH77DRAFT_545143 [Trametes cingulata]|nr:hypothetical protein OH77DRAFT_545143 [Trametes cingulata]
MGYRKTHAVMHRAVVVRRRRCRCCGRCLRPVLSRRGVGHNESGAHCQNGNNSTVPAPTRLFASRPPPVCTLASVGLYRILCHLFSAYPGLPSSLISAGLSAILKLVPQSDMQLKRHDGDTPVLHLRSKSSFHLGFAFNVAPRYRPAPTRTQAALRCFRESTDALLSLLATPGSALEHLTPSAPTADGIYLAWPSDQPVFSPPSLPLPFFKLLCAVLYRMTRILVHCSVHGLCPRSGLVLPSMHVRHTVLHHRAAFRTPASCSDSRYVSVSLLTAPNGDVAKAWCLGHSRCGRPEARGVEHHLSLPLHASTGLR